MTKSSRPADNVAKKITLPRLGIQTWPTGLEIDLRLPIKNPISSTFVSALNQCAMPQLLALVSKLTGI